MFTYALLQESWQLSELESLFRHKPQTNLDEVDIAYLDKIHDFIKGRKAFVYMHAWHVIHRNLIILWAK